jgi:hypothetical protein
MYCGAQGVASACAIDVINTRGTIAYIGPGCNAGSFESFAKLKEALQTIHEGHRIP